MFEDVDFEITNALEIFEKLLGADVVSITFEITCFSAFAASVLSMKSNTATVPAQETKHDYM